MEAYQAIGSPAYVIFGESNCSINSASLDTNKAYKVHVNNKRAIFSANLNYTDPSDLLGNWAYEIDDLSIFLTARQ